MYMVPKTTAAEKRSHCTICFTILAPLETFWSRYLPPRMPPMIQIRTKAPKERHQTKSARMRLVPSRILATKRKAKTTIRMSSNRSRYLDDLYFILLID